MSVCASSVAWTRVFRLTRSGSAGATATEAIQGNGVLLASQGTLGDVEFRLEEFSRVKVDAKPLFQSLTCSVHLTHL